ncbi:hypothetical protein [Synechococcus sp. W70.1]|jgi:hypothetical protein|uniref:hypothetical protein n=1 Tax=unclassified Synechococcus TaxID=2626047 RepID=UPI0039C350A2
MAIDNTLLWVLVATAGLSLLSLVYVWVDEALKRRRYERQKQEEAVPSTAAASEPEAGIPPAAPEPEAEPSPPAQEVTATPETLDTAPEQVDKPGETPET